MNNSLKYIIVIISVSVAFFAFVFFFNYVEEEGFNPTDEGVVLANSWRVINGEIPHKNFISIRPAMSAYLHTINFILDTPIVVNARYFVLFQYLTIACIISILSYGFLMKTFKKFSYIFFTQLLLLALALTIFNYNLYSWTTIDAMFWTMIGIACLYKEKNIYLIIGLFCLSLAALSRQTFAVLLIAGIIYVFLKTKHNILKFIIYSILGLLPCCIYLAFVIANDGLNDLILQMTVRTEFFKTAILQFVKYFFLTKYFIMNALTIVISAYIYRNKTKINPNKLSKIVNIVVVTYLILVLVAIASHFINNMPDNNIIAFDLFYILFFISCFHFIIKPQNRKLRLFAFVIIFISWTSAISLGDNCPVFAVGILFTLIITIAIDIMSINVLNRSKINVLKISSLVFTSLILGLSYYGQKNINYRDNSSDSLKLGLGNINNNFGNIKTNSLLISYYSELYEIYNQLDNVKNNFIVFPNNSIFYPITKTQNPISIDWFNSYEYAGQEDRLERELLSLKEAEHTYIIIDKINLRTINQFVENSNYQDNKMYNFIVSNYTKYNDEYTFFEVYCNK